MPFLDLIKRMCHRTSDQSLQVWSWFIAIGKELYSYIYLFGSLKIYIHFERWKLPRLFLGATGAFEISF